MLAKSNFTDEHPPSYALKHFHIDGHSAVCITGIFQQILQCMDSVILQPASAEEARNAYRQHLSDMYGIDVLINDVLPMCTDAEFLRDITYHIPSSLPVPVLDNMLADTYKKEHTREWQEILIKRNHRTALIQYYEVAKSAHSIPDMTHGSLVPSLTDSISYITDPRLVDVIIQLLRLCNTPNFVDKGSFGLRHSCWESIKRIGELIQNVIRYAAKNTNKLATVTL